MTFVAILFNETSVYVNWDDHEVTDNYCRTILGGDAEGFPGLLAGSPSERRAAANLPLFFFAGAEPWSFSYSTRASIEIEKKSHASKEQKAVALRRHRQSLRFLKFVVTSVPMDGGGSDRWWISEGREQILRYINDKSFAACIFSAVNALRGDHQNPPGRRTQGITAGPLRRR